MRSRFPLISGFERYAIGVLGCFLAAWGCAHFSGCATAAGAARDTNGIPNLRLVEPSVYRGGQPDTAGWQWLREAGVSNVVKLNTQDEGSDKPAVVLGMRLSYFPVDTLQQLISGPDPTAMSNAVARIGPGTYVHCLHGQDRTGLVIGLYRLQEGTNAAEAWQEMTNCGFHPALLGLTHYWTEHSGP